MIHDQSFLDKWPMPIRKGHPIDNKDIEEIFKDEVLHASDKPMAASMPQQRNLFTRLYYAVFLNNAYGAERIDDIKNLLDPVYQTKNKTDYGLFVYLQNLVHYPNERYFKRELLDLAKTVPEFKDLLTAAGWGIE